MEQPEKISTSSGVIQLGLRIFNIGTLLRGGRRCLCRIGIGLNVGGLSRDQVLFGRLLTLLCIGYLGVGLLISLCDLGLRAQVREHTPRGYDRSQYPGPSFQEEFDHAASVTTVETA